VTEKERKQRMGGKHMREKNERGGKARIRRKNRETIPLSITSYTYE